jgi:DNA-binding transcriptional LysR family regulator
MELRHLRYFVAAVEWKGLREASRQLHVAQSAISQTLTNLENELGTKLFARSGRTIQLTPPGEIFYAETVRTLAQSQHAIEAAQRAARGEVGQLSIGFSGAATYSFLPDLVRRYKAKFPGVKLALREVTPLQQERAFAQDSIDVGFTRPLPKAWLRGSIQDCSTANRCLLQFPLPVPFRESESRSRTLHESDLYFSIGRDFRDYLTT